MIKPQFRADHVGSLQRPLQLLEEIHRTYERGHTAKLAEEREKDLSRLTALEDETIREVIARQEEVGLDVVTDGEFRRLMYFNSFFDAVEGVAPSENKLLFQDDNGSVVEHEGPVAIVGRLRKTDSPAAREAAFARKLTDKAIKITFPTASFLVAQVALGPTMDLGAYETIEEAATNLVKILRELVDEAILAGATYIQFDISGYMMLAASPLADTLMSRGIDLDKLLKMMLDADRQVVNGLPAHVTTCMHQCRGNYASRYITKHDHLNELSEAFFTLPYDRFTLEWDDHVTRTADDYAALERIPKGGPTVVMGVVSTRHTQIENADDIVRKVEKASLHVPIEQIAISPQCGFSSALGTGGEGQPDGNMISQKTQWEKLRLLVTTADRIWGSS